MKAKIAHLSNIIVLVALGVFLLHPDGRVRKGVSSWKAERAQVETLRESWDVLVRRSDDREHVIQAAGRIRLVEFTDYQCPFCARMHELQQRMGLADDVIGVRHLPIRGIHPNAELAALISICAERHGATWARVHDLLFAIADSLQVLDWTRVLHDIGIDDPATVETCVSSPQARAKLAEDERLAATLGIRATPTYVSRNRIATGVLSETELQDLIARDE